MSFASRIRSAQNGNLAGVASTTITGATQTVNGAQIDLYKVQPGTEVVCTFTLGVTTSSVVITPSIQVSRDGTNWLAYRAGTATAGGTGTLVTTTSSLGSYSSPPFKYIRGSAVSSGASAVSGDTISFAWDYLVGGID